MEISESPVLTRILCLDPGEHTGWCLATVFHRDGHVLLYGGTVDKNHVHVHTLLNKLDPDIVVLESFHMYPGMAKSLSWNSFYTCEVIGVIKVWCELRNIKWIEQAPSTKKFSGGLQDDWKQDKDNFQLYVAQTGLADAVGDYGIMEHSKDAYLHWKYFQRNTWPKIRKDYVK